MEGHAGADQLNTSAADDASPPGNLGRPPDDGADDTASPAAEPVSAVAEEAPSAGPSRLGGGWVRGICAALLVLTAGVGTGGYCALRSDNEIRAIARDNATAVAAAKDCVTATQVPDTAALPAAQRKILECATGAFAAQNAVYATMLEQAYQAADAHVQVAEMRTAVERDNPDGSVDLLVALRVKIDSIMEHGQLYGYRMRVKMARDAGQYKIANLDLVTK